MPEKKMTYPLLDAQLGILLACSSRPASANWNLPSMIAFDKTFSVERVAEAVKQICETRAELHLRLVRTEEGEVRQYIDPKMAIPIERTTMTDQAAEAYMHDGFVRPFELFGDHPLCRFEIVETERRILLLLDFHHCIADGYTIARQFLGNDLPAAYQRQPLPPPLMTLTEWACHEKEELSSPRYERAKDYYQKLFADFEAPRIAPPLAPAKRGEDGEKKGDLDWGRCINTHFLVSSRETDEWCKGKKTSSQHLLMAAFCITLGKLAHQRRVYFSTLNHGRYDKRLANAYGMFVSTIPFMVHLDAEEHLDGLLTQLRRRLMESIRHRTYPYTHFCHDTGIIPRITFGFQSDNIMEHNLIDGRQVVGRQLARTDTPNDLSVMVYSTGSHYDVRIEASDALYAEADLERFATAMGECLRQLMSHENPCIGSIDLMDKQEKETLLRLSAGEHTDTEADLTFVRLFLRQVAKTPSHIAVDDTHQALTYRQLEEQSRAVAHWLGTRGVRAGSFVGLDATPSSTFLVGALAIMRAGGAYVPIDPHLPKQRRQHILTDAGIHILLDAGNITSHATPVTMPDDLDLSHSQGAAYMIYTSGTTGMPKGVVIRHAGLANLIHFCVRRWPLTSESRIACHSTLAFDASVEDLFPVLTVGGCVMPLGEDTRTDLDAVALFLHRHHITGGCYTTLFGVALAEAHPLAVDYFCVGGERLTSVPPVNGRIYNTYGPTEFTVDATYYEIEKGRHYTHIPIGRPVDNCHALVVDPFGCLLPQGAVGELWLAGPQVAAGYWNAPALTAERFTPCPFCEGTVYHTGDLVRWNDEGLLEYVGRKDRQVKIGGIRVSLEEIERHLLEMPGVEQVAVVAPEVHGKPQVHAYYTANHPIDAHEMAQWLKPFLLPQMMPTRWEQLCEMPLTPSGKTDRKLLAQRHLQSGGETLKERNLPSNATEAALCALFTQILGEAHVAPDDDFFDLGGTSISAMRLTAEARKRGYALTYGDIFAHPTVRQLAMVFLQNPNTNTSQVTSLTPEEETSPIPAIKEGEIPTGESRARQPLHILLTGATGFLGIHLLRCFLLDTNWNVECLMRAPDEPQALKRLQERWTYYFGDECLDLGRVSTLQGDLSQPSLTSVLANVGKNYDMVVNSAADVRYFAKDDNIRKVNTLGVDQLAQWCVQTGTPMIQISTVSATGTAGDTAQRQQFIDQYSLSKFLAEQLLLKRMKSDGLRTSIIRVGLLGEHSSYGCLPISHTSNMLWMVLQTLTEMNCLPQSAHDITIGWTPVDHVAHRICTCCATMPQSPVIHIGDERHESLAVMAERHAHHTLPSITDEAFDVRLRHHPMGEVLRQALHLLRPAEP